jgi:branched-chain amino acid transport system permease protein
MIVIFIFTVFNQSWNLVLGYSGILSFGHLALFGVGAYTSALLSVHAGVTPYVGTLAGGVAAAVASLIMGLPSLRLRGVYIVLFTLGFHEILQTLITTDTSNFTKGGFGLFGIGQYGLENATQDTRIRVFYYVALLLFVLATAVIGKLVLSPPGLALRALRDSEAYAVSRGVAAYRYRVVMFTVSAFICGFIGAFYAHYLNAVSPSMLDFGLMMNLLAMIVIGGWGSFWGPLVGTVALSWLDEGLASLDEWRQFIFGAVMVLFVLAFRRGLWGLATDVAGAAGRWLEEFLDDGGDDDDENTDGTARPAEASAVGGRA